MKGKASKRKAASEESQESEKSNDEEVRDRAITFMMSVGEKRAFENRKKREKEDNERVKLLFVTIVSSYTISQARIMKVIDMTNEATLKNK